MRTAALLCALLPALAFAQDNQTVEAEGQAAIGQPGKVIARDKALEDALRRAVEQACGTLVSSETRVSNSVLISDKILSQAKGYVSKYDVLLEGEDKGVVTVRIKAVVGTQKLSDDLAAIGVTLARKGMPRVALLIWEQRIDEVKPVASWGMKSETALKASAMKLDTRTSEAILLKDWTKKGFHFIDSEALANNVKISGIISLDLTDEQARDIGNRAEADVVIYGRAISTKTADVKDLLQQDGIKAANSAQVGCIATVTLRAINTDNGAVLAAGEESERRVDLSALSCGQVGLVKATEKLSAQLQADVLAAWNRQLLQGNTVRLKISNVDSMKTWNAIKTQITANVRGVKSVNHKPYKNGVADMDLVLTATADEVATQLENTKFANKKVKVTSMSTNLIEVELSK